MQYYRVCPLSQLRSTPRTGAQNDTGFVLDSCGLQPPRIPDAAPDAPGLVVMGVKRVVRRVPSPEVKISAPGVEGVERNDKMDAEREMLGMSEEGR